MSTSPQDPRIADAVKRAMQLAYSKLGAIDAKGAFVWNAVRPSYIGQPWCGGFIVYIYRLLGIDLMRCTWFYYVPSIKAFAESKGLTRDESGYGRLAIFNWDSDAEADHVGISNPDPDSELFRSIEGNTSAGVAGSQSNGGGVFERYRDAANIECWIDMHALLAWMIDAGLWNGELADAPHREEIAVDGVAGQQTIRALQQALGTPADGIISSQFDFHSQYWPAHGAGWEWTHDAEGSSCIEALQKKLGIEADGYAGPQTVQALQRRIGVPADGYAGPQTIRALQTRLNKGLFQ